MSASIITCDYELLHNIAKQFGREADAVRDTLQRLRRQKEMLQHGQWVGRGASAFYAEMETEILPSIQRLAQALSAAQQTTVNLGRLFQQAEAEAEALFRGQGGEAGPPVAAPGASVPPTQGKTNWIPPGLEAAVKALLPKLSKFGLPFLKRTPLVGIGVSLVFNAYKYWDADPDGSFDWSRFLIESAKDTVLTLAAPAVGTFIAGLLGIPATATLGTLVPALGAAGGIGATIAGISAAPLIGGVATGTFDALFGQTIVDGLDNFFHQFARSLSRGFQPAAALP